MKIPGWKSYPEQILVLAEVYNCGKDWVIKITSLEFLFTNIEEAVLQPPKMWKKL